MGSTDTVNPPIPPSPDPTIGMIAMAEAGKEKMAYQVGGMIMTSQMQTNMMNLATMERTQMHMADLDAKMAVAELNYEARMKEAQMGHKEQMTELANRHIETLAKNDEIELDSKDYGGGYPYQFG